MSAYRITRIAAAAILVISVSAYAGAQSKAQPPQKPMTVKTRMDVIRALNAELVYARHAFPMGQKGLTLKDGAISPSENELRALLASYGAAVKPGDPTRITAVVFSKDAITLELNGGPRRKAKWYQRIQVGGMGGTVPISPQDPQTVNARGSYLRLAFDKFVPEMSVDQLKQLLKPVLNFDAKSVVEAYLDTVPPKVRDAIKNHRVLVGMDREMVTYAKGRAPRKIRERDGGTEYEEWIYGEPPQDVEFVRFVGDEVVRTEIMKIDGQKIVQTAKEVELGPPKPAAAPEQPVANKPTLRRPGEAAPAAPPPGTQPGPAPMPPTQGPPPPALQ
jgi:hypothetical protein